MHDPSSPCPDCKPLTLSQHLDQTEALAGVWTARRLAHASTPVNVEARNVLTSALTAFLASAPDDTMPVPPAPVVITLTNETTARVVLEDTAHRLMTEACYLRELGRDDDATDALDASLALRVAALMIGTSVNPYQER